MKKTQFKELISTIKETLVSFISITIFVALSIGIFVGTSWSSKALLNSASSALENSNSKDIELLYPYGIDEKGIETLSRIDGVDEIEGCYTGYSFFEIDDVKYQTKLIQIHESIDLPLSYEGELPSKYNEIGIDALFASTHNINIGDIIEFDSDNNGDEARTLVRLLDYDANTNDLSSIKESSDNPMAYLKTNKFIVTALMRSTDYLSVNQNTYGVSLTNQLILDCFAFLPKIAFDTTSFDGYPDVLIRSNELRKYSIYSDEYKENVETLSQEIKSISAESIVNDKNRKIKDKVESIRVNAQSQLDSAQDRMNNALSQIEEGKNLLNGGQAKLDETKNKLNEAEKEYSTKKAQIDDIASKYYPIRDGYFNLKERVISGAIDEDYVIEHRDEIENVILNIINYINSHDEDRRFSDVTDFLLELVANLDEPDVAVEMIYELIGVFNRIEDYIAMIDNELQGYYNELNAGREQLDSYWKEYNNAVKEYQNKKSQVVDAEKLISSSQDSYVSGVEKLNQFIKSTEDIKEYGCTIFTSVYNIGLSVCEILSDLFSKLKFSMASLFVCVGLLVCFSAISRIINDSTISIGTKKALGLTQHEITMSYMSYTLFSIVIGSIIGNICGYFVVEKTLVNAVSNSFVFKTEMYFSLFDALAISGLEALLLLFITYFACKSILKRDAVKLLTGQDTIQGKRRFYEKLFIWKKLPLLTKTIINNCFNDKRRVFGTLVGIAGATSLIVTALTLNDNVLDSFKIQYSELHHFDTIVNFDNTDSQASDDIVKVLEENDISYAKVFFSRIFVNTPDGGYITSMLFVPEDYDKFEKMMTIRPTVKYSEDTRNGFWMTESYNSYYDCKEGDTISLISLSGESDAIVPSGYYENYLTNYHIVVDKESYKASLGEDVKSNAFIISTFDTNRDELMAKLRDVPGYITNMYYYQVTRGSFDAFEMVSKAIVIVYIVLSIIMAFLVLLNLLVMFVNEKKRELIVLMINGYFLKDAKKYIYSDTIFLSIIGIALGCVIGTIMGNAAVSSFESNATIFLHRIDYKACAIGAGGTVILTFIVSLVALSRISKFKLTDINKQ